MFFRTGRNGVPPCLPTRFTLAARPIEHPRDAAAIATHLSECQLPDALQFAQVDLSGHPEVIPRPVTASRSILTLPTGVREIGLAATAAVLILLLLSASQSVLLRGLETASLDLRFRIRGVESPGSAIALVMVDDRSVDTLGDWPLSHRLFAKALDILNRDGAKVIAFDILFGQPERAMSAQLRAAVREAAALLSEPRDVALRSTLNAAADDDPDGAFENAIRASGNVFLPLAFIFTGNAGEAPSFLSDLGYQRFDKTSLKPDFPLQPVSVLTPLSRWAEAAAGLGHVNIAFDRDGAPRYDYLALPFKAISSRRCRCAPSPPISACNGRMWAWLWPTASISGDCVPTDPAMRLLINYRGPRGTIPTYSFVDLIEDKVPPADLAGRIVLIGASFTGIPDANGPRSAIRRSPAPSGWPTSSRRSFPAIYRGEPAALAADPDHAARRGAGGRDRGRGAALLPTRLAVLGPRPLPIARSGAAAHNWPSMHGLWLPLVSPLSPLWRRRPRRAAVPLWFVDRQRRPIRSAFRALSGARSGRCARRQSRAAAARRRDPHADHHVQRHPRLHLDLRAVQGQPAGAQPADQPRAF